MPRSTRKTRQKSKAKKTTKPPSAQRQQQQQTGFPFDPVDVVRNLLGEFIMQVVGQGEGAQPPPGAASTPPPAPTPGPGQIQVGPVVGGPKEALQQRGQRLQDVIGDLER